MPAHQVGGGRAHGGEVRGRSGHPAHPVGLEGRGFASQVQEVAVVLPARILAGVEGGRSPGQAFHPDVARQQGVEAMHQPCRGERLHGAEVGDLAAGVHAGIGPASTGHGDRLPQEAPQGLLEAPLDGVAAALDLPSGKGRPQVRDRHPEGLHSFRQDLLRRELAAMPPGPGGAPPCLDLAPDGNYSLAPN